MNTKKQESLIGFKKANGLISKIIEMAEKDEYCIDIMQQNLALLGLLRSAHKSLMEGHLATCFKAAMAANNEAKKKKMVQEILKVTNWSNK